MKTTKRDLIICWDDLDEISQDLACSDEEILEMLPAIRERVKQCIELLGDMFSVDEYNEIFPLSDVVLTFCGKGEK
jgi:hypothetical protein